MKIYDKSESEFLFFKPKTKALFAGIREDFAANIFL